MEEVNVREVFKKKNPKLAKFIPGFIFQYIERIVHQDEVNHVIRLMENKFGLDYVDGVLDYFNLKVDVIGEENIPTEGRYIFASNHPLGGLDGLVFAQVIGRKNPDVKFLVNDILMVLKNMDGIFIPVNKHGRQSTDYFKKIEDTYQSDDPILNFPAGLCSRKVKGEIIDPEWKKSFISKAVQYKRDVVPVYMSGKNSNFFYNLANFRNRLGIKANLEMMYLVDELFKQKNSHMTVTIGKPIPYTTFDKSKNYLAWAKEIKDFIYKLKNNPKEVFSK